MNNISFGKNYIIKTKSNDMASEIEVAVNGTRMNVLDHKSKLRAVGSGKNVALIDPETYEDYNDMFAKLYKVNPKLTNRTYATSSKTS